MLLPAAWLSTLFSPPLTGNCTFRAYCTKQLQNREKIHLCVGEKRKKGWAIAGRGGESRCPLALQLWLEKSCCCLVAEVKRCTRSSSGKHTNISSESGSFRCFPKLSPSYQQQVHWQAQMLIFQAPPAHFELAEGRCLCMSSSEVPLAALQVLPVKLGQQPPGREAGLLPIFSHPTASP